MNKIKFNNMEELKQLNFDTTNNKNKPFILDIQNLFKNNYISSLGFTSYTTKDNTEITLTLDINCEDILENDQYYYNSYEIFKFHNIINKTYGKQNTPVICFDSDSIIKIISFYCNDCKSSNVDYDLNGYIDIKDNTLLIKAKQIKCPKCGKFHNISDCKLVTKFYSETTKYSNLYLNDEKVMFAAKRLFYTYNDNRVIFCEGVRKEHINIKTGYSFTSLSGSARLNNNYSTEVRLPSFINSTYTHLDNCMNILDDISLAKFVHEYLPSLNLTSRDEIEFIIKNNMKEYIAATLKEIIQQATTHIREQIYILHNKKVPEFGVLYDNYLSDLDSYYKDKILKNIKFYNRFPYISSNNYVATKAIFNDITKKYKINRWSSNLQKDIFDYYKIPLSKRAAKLILKLDGYSLISVFGLCNGMKCKDNIYRVIKNYVDHKCNKMTFSWGQNYTKEWLKYRHENYITNYFCDFFADRDPKKHYMLREGISMKALTKHREIKDTLAMSVDVSEVLGEKISLKKYFNFKNESQLHDDLILFYNSDEYMHLKDKVTNIEFKLEKDINKLEYEDFYIAKESRTLNEIGRKMRICVGGYSDDVARGHCRIAYIKENDKYLCCLELKPRISGKKVKYKLVQAKQFANNLAKNDLNLNNKIMQWCNDNNIVIDTYDIDTDVDTLINKDTNINKTLHAIAL